MNTVRRQWHRPVGYLVGASALVLVVGLAQAAPGDPTDPAAEPVPVAEYVDDARSFVAAVDFTSLASGAGAGAVVAQVATPGTSHLRADVVVRAEAEGQLVGSSTMPHPAESFADGEGFFFQAGRYDVLAPFDARVDTLRLTTPDGTTIAAVDVTGAVRQYCVDNPGDPACLEADLSVTSVLPTGPLFAVLGRASTVTVDSTVVNEGPDGPVDARVTRTASAATGLAVTPVVPRTSTASLAVDEPTTLRDTWTVTCTAPGTHLLTLTTSAVPRLARVVDTQPANDSRTVTLSVDCAVPVAINIQPGSRTNPVSLTGSTLPIAVLTTTAGEYGLPVPFDATLVDPGTLRFGSEAALLAARGVPELHAAIHPEDALELDERTRDGDRDALTHFRPRKDVLTLADTSGCVFGRTVASAGSLAFFGCDLVRVQK